MSDNESKVRDLAKLSMLSNRISEIHEKNLKAYPYIFFNGLLSAEIDYNLERGEKNHVAFKITLKEDSENPFMEKRLDALDKSIKNLFWKEVSVSIELDGKKVFDSNPNSIENVAQKFMDNNKELMEDLAKLEESEKSK